MKALSFSFALVVLLSLIVSSCGKEDQSITQPSVSIEPPYQLTLTNNCDFVVNIYIDNQDMGIIQPVQSRVYALKEGAHFITMEGAGQSATSNVYVAQDMALTTCQSSVSAPNYLESGEVYQENSTN